MKAEYAGQQPEGTTLDDVLREFEPLLQGIAAVARGNDLYRPDIEAMFPFLEEHGWRITEAVRRIWAGERDWFSLMYGLDIQDSALLKRILDLIEQPVMADLVSELPPAVRQGLSDQDVQAINDALEELPPTQAQAIVQELLDSGMVSQPAATPTPADLPEAGEWVLPPAITAALEAEDVDALQAALDALPEEEAQAVLDRLAEAGVVGLQPSLQTGRVNLEEVLRRFDPLLQAVADVAAGRGGAQLQAEIEAILPQLEENGWHLTVAVQLLWAGERELDALTVGQDGKNVQLIRRLLEMVENRA
jgi:DNA-directed RNA polymerase specialized sigma24 family protein